MTDHLGLIADDSKLGHEVKIPAGWRELASNEPLITGDMFLLYKDDKPLGWIETSFGNKGIMPKQISAENRYIRKR